jgi:hypothetical protein
VKSKVDRNTILKLISKKEGIIYGLELFASGQGITVTHEYSNETFDFYKR